VLSHARCRAIAAHDAIAPTTNRRLEMRRLFLVTAASGHPLAATGHPLPHRPVVADAMLRTKDALAVSAGWHDQSCMPL
jgi:hypothetical protein